MTTTVETTNNCPAGGPGCSARTCDTTVNAGPMGTWTTYRTCAACGWIGEVTSMTWVTPNSGYSAYPAVSIAGPRWNGFLMPSFDQHTAEQIVRETVEQAQQNGLRWTAEWAATAVTITDENDCETYEHVTEKNIDGTYSIGAAWWTWETE